MSQTVEGKKYRLSLFFSCCPENSIVFLLLRRHGFKAFFRSAIVTSWDQKSKHFFGPCHFLKKKMRSPPFFPLMSSRDWFRRKRTPLSVQNCNLFHKYFVLHFLRVPRLPLVFFTDARLGNRKSLSLRTRKNPRSHVVMSGQFLW